LQRAALAEAAVAREAGAKWPKSWVGFPIGFPNESWTSRPSEDRTQHAGIPAGLKRVDPGGISIFMGATNEG
jgi:hypothetical protein